MNYSHENIFITNDFSITRSHNRCAKEGQIWRRDSVAIETRSSFVHGVTKECYSVRDREQRS